MGESRENVKIHTFISY